MSRPESRGSNPIVTSIEKLREEMDNVLEAVWSNGERALGAFGLSSPGKSWVPVVDVAETDEYVLVYADLPAVDPQAVDVTLAGNMLTIKGERPALAPHPTQVVHHSERRHGAFKRSIPLPVPVNPENVSAETKNGMLTVRLAKQQSAKARHIPIAAKGTGDATPPTI